jgi:hypothetical protein
MASDKQRDLRLVNRIENGIRKLSAISFVLTLLIAGISQSSEGFAGEEIKLEATATWASKGNIFFVGEKNAMFVGGFSGVMFVSQTNGGLNAANIVCPGMMDINIETGQTSGEGRCIISGASGDQLFAKWSCAGFATLGCKGDFELTAGTGPFQGVKGGGAFSMRTAIGELGADLQSGKLTSIGLGLAEWPSLTLIMK